MPNMTIKPDPFCDRKDQLPELPSILQAWWDREAVHSPLFIVLCGSQRSAMTALGQESAPLFGRFNAGIFQLDPLHYEDVAAFYAAWTDFGVVEKLLMYGVLEERRAITRSLTHQSRSMRFHGRQKSPCSSESVGLS
jgi:hypothetical protein